MPVRHISVIFSPAMARRTRKRKAKITKGFAIAIAVIALLLFVVKEILTENLKEIHDSLVAAEGQFRVEQGQSLVSAQMLLHQEIETLQLETQARRSHPDNDYSVLIEQEILAAHQAQLNLDADFDSVSRLIDQLPSTARLMRQSRDQMRTQVVEKADQYVKDVAKRKPDHDVWRLINVELVRVVALEADLPVLLLGDSALTGKQGTDETFTGFLWHGKRFCGRVTAHGALASSGLCGRTSACNAAWERAAVRARLRRAGDDGDRLNVSLVFPRQRATDSAGGSLSERQHLLSLVSERLAGTRPPWRGFKQRRVR